MTYRRRRVTTFSPRRTLRSVRSGRTKTAGLVRSTVVTRSRSPKTGARPGRGWFTWAWGNRRRGRANLPSFFGFEKLFMRKVRRRR